MKIPLSNVKAYILTGGDSRRMNMDKSLVKLDGAALTEIIHRELSIVFNSITIVGKENHFPHLNYIQDINPVQCPLNGIITALENSTADWIFLIACDIPFVKTENIKLLYDNANSLTQAVVPILKNSIQPLCAFYHKSILKFFNAGIQRRDYSIKKLLPQVKLKKVTISSKDDEQFLNINCPNDLIKAENILYKNKNN